jgi:predicted PolB exonuclease-like 3'-5' exonuclease
MSRLTKTGGILYLDIETSSKYKNLEEFQNKDKSLFEVFNNKFYNKEITDDFYKQESPLNPTFGKITCISMAYELEGEFKIRSFTGDEKEILENCYNTFVNSSNSQYKLCGYNLINFDMPWINIKMLKYKLKIPGLFSIFEKKPWELNVFDIYNEIKLRNVSLIELCHELGIKVPVHRGIQMDEYYWNGEIDKIIEHCESDVESVYKVYKIIYDLNS